MLGSDLIVGECWGELNCGNRILEADGEDGEDVWQLSWEMF
jgi:hypothetical protein